MTITFALARAADEHDIRRILRENPVGGKWRISFEREPNGLGGPYLPEERQVIILARDSNSGSVVGLCERLVRPAFVNGKRQLLPYLGALRITESYRRRIAILRGGFQTLREFAEQPDECRFALTSIAADNQIARRVLTADLDGIPRYQSVGGYATLMMRARAERMTRAITYAGLDDYGDIAAFLDQQTAHRQCAPAWSAAALAAQTGLSFLVAREAGAIEGVIGIWDQRQSRQAVLRGLPPKLGAARRSANILAPLLSLPSIPAPGKRIEQAFLTSLAVRDEVPDLAVALVASGLNAAKAIGADVATIGVPVSHPWRAAIQRRFRAIQYETELFIAYWPDASPIVDSLEIAHVFPDVAML